MVCPAGLQPFAIRKSVKYGSITEELRKLHAGDCIECGCCAYTCPANIPLLDYCKIAKKYGVDRPEYYAELTKAWLEDKDAVPEKAGLYYKYIVEH